MFLLGSCINTLTCTHAHLLWIPPLIEAGAWKWNESQAHFLLPIGSGTSREEPFSHSFRFLTHISRLVNLVFCSCGMLQTWQTDREVWHYRRMARSSVALCQALPMCCAHFPPRRAWKVGLTVVFVSQVKKQQHGQVWKSTPGTATNGPSRGMVMMPWCAHDAMVPSSTHPHDSHLRIHGGPLCQAVCLFLFSTTSCLLASG